MNDVVIKQDPIGISVKRYSELSGLAPRTVYDKLAEGELEEITVYEDGRHKKGVLVSAHDLQELIATAERVSRGKSLEKGQGNLQIAEISAATASNAIYPQETVSDAVKEMSKLLNAEREALEKLRKERDEYLKALAEKEKQLEMQRIQLDEIEALKEERRSAVKALEVSKNEHLAVSTALAKRENNKSESKDGGFFTKLLKKLFDEK